MSVINSAVLLAQMKLNQWKSQDETESMQEERLKALFAYASEHVPYYRKTMKGASVKDLEDLARLPLTKKHEIRTQTDSFLSDRYRKGSLKMCSTSGSSGTPLDIFHHPSEGYHGPALEIHQLTEVGVSPFDIQARIHYIKDKPRILQRLGIFRRRHLPMDAGESDNLPLLMKMRPRALLSHASYLASLAQVNLASGAPLKVDKVFSYSEVLTARARELITKSFRCDLYDMYGIVETSWAGWQCEKGSIHLYSDSVVAEIVDDHGNPVKRGEYGNVILTTLWKRSMPLIRYQVGDRSAFGPKCRCGRGWHTLKTIEGRDIDFIVLPSGRTTSARQLDVVIRYLPGVLLFQAIQEKAGELHVKMVPVDRPPPLAAQEEFIKQLSTAFPEPIKATLEVVDRLPRGKSGKIPYMVSKVEPGVRV